MNRIAFKILVFVAGSSFLTACNTYEFPKSPYPRIETLPAINMSTSGVTFKANITQLDNLPIIDHGFVWGTDDKLLITSGEEVQLGGPANLGIFETTVESTLIVQETYFVKAFVATKTYIVYGDIVSFTIK